jgi:glycerol uptake facilitator-like aquaporin
MKKYIVEFIGTFFFILTIGCTVIGSPIGSLAAGGISFSAV